jgi:putative SOS response-associated peptidase YedK
MDFMSGRRLAKKKQPYYFGMADDSVFAFAGIGEWWKALDGTLVESCSILTTTPNSLAADVHDRMPMILDRDDYEQWLDPGLKAPSTFTELLKPYPAKKMRSYPVSQLANSPKNEKLECIVEIAFAAIAQASV